jgi:hypothetical protein
MDQSSDKSEIEQLERLSKLHSDGALTDKEFAQLKARLVASKHEWNDHAGVAANPNSAEPHAPPVPNHGHAGTRFDQDITLAVVAGWAWSVFFAVLGATMLLTGHAAASVCALISALIVFPPLDSFIVSRWEVSFPAALRFLFAFVLLVATGRLLGLTLESFTIPASPASSALTSEQNSSPTGDQSVSSVEGGASNKDDRGSTGEQDSQPITGKQPDSAPVQPSAGATENAPESDISDSIMQPRFGNTVISRSATTEWHLYFNSDHTFTGREIRTNYRVAGTWRIADSNLCMAFQPPLAGTSDPNCKPISAHQLGDNWTVDQSLFTLVEGVQ